jgi:EmrB/QacA subfamily drug resistance transporter
MAGPDEGDAPVAVAPGPGSPTGQPSARAVSRRVIFGVVAVAIFISTIDLTIVATALPNIQRHLHTSVSWAGWTITIYSLGTVVALPAAGKLSDRLGRRRLFVCGVALFTASSLACGCSSNIYMLVIFRALQALGGGTIQPSAAGLVTDHFAADRDRGIGMFGVFASSGQLVGPILGGLIVGYLSWRWIFFVNIPIGVMLVIFTMRYVPESPRRAERGLDVRGLLLLSSLVLAAIIGATNLGNRGTSLDAPGFIVPELAAIALFVSFLRHSARASAPFIPMRLLRGRGFAVMNAVNLLHGIVTFGVMSLVPLYAEERYHFTPVSAGTLLTARAVGMTAIGFFAAFALRRTGYRLPMFVGFSGVALGTVLMSFAPPWHFSPFLWLSVSAAIAGLGLGTVNPAASNAGVQLAPNEAAAITGLRMMFINFGTIVSVSITTAILGRSGDPAAMHANVLRAAAFLIVVALLPLCTRVPEHKGSW